jgi:colicin import membrane protein
MPAINPVTAGSPYQVPPEPNRWPAILLAVAVHAMLLGFLWFGISWQNNEPVAVEAEVWDMKVQAAAPTPPPPQEAEPEPQPQPEPPSVPKVVEQPVPQVAAPDIALEREKKRKEEKLRKELEQRELAEEKARDEAKAKELAKKEADRKKAEELAKQKQAEQKAQELADKKDAEKKVKLEKLAKAKLEAVEKANLDKLRDAEMKRMMAAAEGSGGTGSAAKSTAPRSDSGYVAAITAKVKSTTNYGGSTDVPDNPRVEFHVEQLPTGEIISVKKTRSSGIPAFDDAVEKGIIKASPLPKKKDGTVERSLEIGFKMKDVT